MPGGCLPASPMVMWLKQDLAANPRTCTLAYFHHPLFSSGRHGNQTKMEPTWEALYAAGADVVISGHDHDYERFAPQRPDGTLDNALGITEFVVGTGGRALYDWPLTKTEEFPDGVFIPKPNSIVRNNETHGVLKLTLHPSSYDWQFVPVEGQDFTDYGTGEPCHDVPVPTTTATATIAALPKNGGPELMLPVTLVASLALIASGVGASVLLRRSL